MFHTAAKDRVRSMRARLTVVEVEGVRKATSKRSTLIRCQPLVRPSWPNSIQGQAERANTQPNAIHRSGVIETVLSVHTRS